jgi:hypothetical protein
MKAKRQNENTAFKFLAWRVLQPSRICSRRNRHGLLKFRGIGAFCKSHHSKAMTWRLRHPDCS